jgi:hypothetical protein
MKLRKTQIGILALMFALFGCGNGEVDSSSTSTTPPPPESTTSSIVERATTTTIATTTTTAAPTTTTSLEGATREAPIPVGGVVQVGDWRLRVTEVTPDATDLVMAENQFNDPPSDGSQFFIAQLEATYTGTGSSTFWVDISLAAVGDSSVAYEEGFDASCGVIPADIDHSGETFPGGTITGDVCWSVQSSDADSLVMIAEQSFTFDDTRRFLSLDPTATPLDESTAVENSGVGQVGPTVAIGQLASVGPWDLRVVAVTPDATDRVMAENQFNDPPPDGNQFFIAEIEATYTGGESSTFWVDMSLKAVGDSNVAYEASEATCGVIPGDIDDSGETFPGGTITGNVCWNIQTSDAESLVMIAEQSFTFDDTRTFFALTE